MEKKIVLTRKIQLFIDSKDPALVEETFLKLYEWQRMCRKTANYIYTHCYLQEQVKELLYLTDDVKVKLADIKKDGDGILTTSKTNTTYQMLGSHFKGVMPMSIMSALNNILTSLYQKERSDYAKGVRSLRNYKRDIPIPLNPCDFRQLSPTEKGGNFSFNLFGIPFRTYLGRDFYDKRVLLERVIKKEVKLCISSIKLYKGKIYWLAAFEYEQEQHSLNTATIAEAALSIEVPIVVKINKRAYNIGNKEEFMDRRLAIQAAVDRTKRTVSFARGGHGRKRKLKGLDKFQDAEARYVDQKLHVYSRRLIDVCIKNNAGTLLLTNITEAKEESKADAFLLRNWSYSSLKDKIAYKARKAGINVIEE